MCLVLNNEEDQALSSSCDRTIKVRKIIGEEIIYDYTLENKHINSVNCISLNKSETALISNGTDKQIILWTKDKKNKWIYQNHIITDDTGNRIGFINDFQLVWQQEHKGITHLFQIQNGYIISKPELNIELNQEDSDYYFFPTIYNKQKQIIVQKHNQQVYLLQQSGDGKLFVVQSFHLYNINLQTFNCQFT